MAENKVIVRLLTDAIGKPYLELEGDPDGPMPLRMVLHADEIVVEDYRRKKTGVAP